jgi:hypothetical protein
VTPNPRSDLQSSPKHKPGFRNCSIDRDIFLRLSLPAPVNIAFTVRLTNHAFSIRELFGAALFGRLAFAGRGRSQLFCG